MLNGGTKNVYKDNLDKVLEYEKRHNDRYLLLEETMRVLPWMPAEKVLNARKVYASNMVEDGFLPAAMAECSFSSVMNAQGKCADAITCAGPLGVELIESTTVGKQGQLRFSSGFCFQSWALCWSSRDSREV